MSLIADGLKVGGVLTAGSDVQVNGDCNIDGFLTVGKTTQINANLNVQGDRLSVGNGVLRVGSLPAVAGALAGDIRFNPVTQKHEGYNGISWNAMY